MANPTLQPEVAVPPRWRARQIVLAGGIALWVGATLAQTRWGGVVALGNAVLLVLALSVLTAATRTRQASDFIQALSAGGAMLGLAIVGGIAFDASLGVGNGRLRLFAIPMLEEILKITPLLWWLWRRRRGQALTMGVSDVMLLAVALGTGFGWAEGAFIRHHKGWTGSLGWLPTTEMYGDRHGTYLIAGHGVWTGLAGITIGIALLLRRPRLPMALLAASGWLWAVMDHVRNNYANHHRDALAATLNIITGHGWVTAYLFAIGVASALAVDFYLEFAAIPKLTELEFPKASPSWSELKAAIRFLRLRSAFAFAMARHRRATGAAKAQAGLLASALDMWLVNWRR